MENNNIDHTVLVEEEDNFISFKDLYTICRSKWLWFVISLSITLFLSLCYLLTTPKMYQRSASVMIKENAKGNNLGGIDEAFSDMGLFKSRTSVQNEVIAFKSPALTYEVVQRMGLNINYFSEGHFQDKTLYGKGLPLFVEFANLPQNQSSHFDIRFLDNPNKVELSHFKAKRGDEEIESDQTLTVPFGQAIKTPIGILTIKHNPTFLVGKDKDKKDIPVIHVVQSTYTAAMKACYAHLNVGLHDKEASVIDLTYTDVNPQRAKDFLNNLIDIYNENWISDKNQISINTNNFIKERLAVIEQELGQVDASISSFKSKNLIPDIATASTLYLNENSQMGAELLNLNNQLYMTKYVRSYLADAHNSNKLIPANTGINIRSIEEQIGDYNQQLLTRNQIAASSSEQNPIVIDMDQSLKALRGAVMTSINNAIETLKVQIASMERKEQSNNHLIAQNPAQAKYLLTVERQQKVKESLYLYLLQKREETELSQAFSANNTRIITPPMGGDGPISPKKNMILLAALFLGLLIPICIIFIKEVMDTTLRGRKDLEHLNFPIIGDIPLAQKKKWLFFTKRENAGEKILIERNNHDIVNEAFRILRTNIEFSKGKHEDKNVFVMTSFNPGAGKSFITMNLATTLALKNKKVLVIDGDMRHATISKYVKYPKAGLSDYLNGYVSKVEDIITTSKNFDNLHVIPVGTIPPDPSELLAQDLFKELVETLRPKYEYIFIDCPPIDIVADTQIIEKIADRTLFVLRIGVMERSLIPTLKKYQEEKKFKHMSFILNGTYNNDSRYHHKYSYYHK